MSKRDSSISVSLGNTGSCKALFKLTLINVHLLLKKTLQKISNQFNNDTNIYRVMVS